MMLTVSNRDRNLTEQQLGLLNALLDGEWHDRKYIREKLGLKKLIPSIISERIIKPLESIGLVEQENRPIKEGSKKFKKYIRIRKDIDEYNFHQIIIRSSNKLAYKCGTKIAKLNVEIKKAEIVGESPGKYGMVPTQKVIEKYKNQYDHFLAIRDRSLGKCKEIEKIEKENEKKYWIKRESYIPYSQSWPQLVAIEKKIADELEEQLKPFCGTIAEEERKRIPYRAALLARDLHPDLWGKVRQEALKHESDLCNRCGQKHTTSVRLAMSPRKQSSGILRSAKDEDRLQVQNVS